MSKRPVFIDCDPGLDDFVALFAALACDEFDIKGVGSVCGNVGLCHTGPNLMNILSLAGREDIPCAYGASAPLKRECVDAAEVHGENGLHGISLPESEAEPVKESAHELLYRLAKENEGDLEIIALGPLTNIAKAILCYPDLPQLVKQIVIMGGGHAWGNVTPAAEFNIYADPEAAYLVFGSEIPLTMVGLDMTMSAPITEKMIIDCCKAENKVSRMLKEVMAKIMEFSKRIGLGDVAYIHDLSAVLCAIRPDIFELKHLHVDIELDGTCTLGQTVVDVTGVSKRQPNAYVAFGVDMEAYEKLMIELIEKWNKG